VTRLRLIPVLIFAVASLLVVKGLGFLSAERAGERLAQRGPMTIAAAPAPKAAPGPVPDTDLEFTGAAPVAAAPKKEEPKMPPPPPRAPETPPGINVGFPGEGSPAQKALLERLQQRRQELDQRARDLELRENLLREAEQRLEARLKELQRTENPNNPDAAADAPNQKMKNLVTMYEGMKPKDAARIFDKLDMTVLLEVARAMKPVKLAEVLAVMNPDAAQRLTVELARGVSPDRTVPATDLPLVNVPPAARAPAPTPAKR
jgi:flagellar motility protein MotE (MotC chaperone)